MNMAILVLTVLQKIMNTYLQDLTYLPSIPTSLQDASSIKTEILLCPPNIPKAHNHV